MDKYNDSMVCATGTYVNYFMDDGTFDMFVIINEPNGDKVDEVIEYLDSIEDLREKNFEELELELEENCCPWGVQIIKGDEVICY